MLRRFIVPIAAVGLLALSQFGLPFAIGSLGSSGLSFPDPVVDEAVYDPANALDPQTEEALETKIDAIEARSGAEVVILRAGRTHHRQRHQPGRCAPLMDQWGSAARVRRRVVFLISFVDNSFTDGSLCTTRARVQGRIPLGGPPGALATR